MLVLIDDGHNEVLVVHEAASLANHLRHETVEVPHDDRLVFGGRRDQLAIDRLRDAADPLVVLLNSLQEIAVVGVPDTNRLISRARHQVVTVRLQVLDAADFVLVALQRPMTTELLLRIPLPQFNSHVARATCQMVAGRTKANVIHHACVLTQRLFAFTRLVVPQLDCGIL